MEPLKLVRLPLLALTLLGACASPVAPPMASAGMPQMAMIGQIVQLDGSASSDPAKRPLSYSWALIAVPSGSVARLDDPTRQKPSFKVDLAGSYTAQLVVSNGVVSSTPQSVIVTATMCGGNPPTLATADVTATPMAPNVGQVVALSAMATDADNVAPCAGSETFQYAWSFASVPAGSRARVMDATSAAAWFTPDVTGAYVVQVIATDSTGLASAATELTVTAGTCGATPPTAKVAILSPVSAGPATRLTVTKLVPTGTIVQVDASASSDPDTTCAGEVLTYLWQFTSLPYGSTASLNNATIVNPSFQPDQPGNYGLEVLVSDGTATTIATITLTADPAASVIVPSGFSVGTVSAGALAGWDRPMGVTADAAGNVYAVQNGSNLVLEVAGGVAGGATSIFTGGGAIRDGRYLAHDSATNTFFLSDGSGVLVELSAAGAQTPFARPGGGFDPWGLSLGTIGGTASLVAMDQAAPQVDQFDPAATPLAPILANDPMNGRLGGSGWGVALVSIGGLDVLFASRQGNDQVYRTESAFTGGATTVVLSNDPLLNAPTDLVFNPPSAAVHPNGSVLVADTGRGLILAIDNCSGPPCPVSVVASGFDTPEGLYLTSDLKTLYVTDRALNALIAIRGDFSKL